MKIERQIMAPKSIFTKSKLIATDIDNEWNDFLMIRGGCNWESSADTGDDGNNSVNSNGKNNNKNNKNSNNHNNENKNCDKKYEEMYKKNDYANKWDGDDEQEQQQTTLHLPRLESNTDSDDDGVQSQPFEQQQFLRSCANSANEQEQVPVCSPIYISTKTKISYLNTEIDIKKVFWDIPVMPYSSQCKGIVKKQIKFSSITKEELAEIEERVQTEVEKKRDLLKHKSLSTLIIPTVE